MTLTASLLLDLVLLTLLVYFFIQGIRRGFILTLCSLLAVFVALGGGWYLSHHYADALQEKIEPVIFERLVSKSETTREEESQEDSPLPEGVSQTVQEQMQEAVSAVQTTVAAQESVIIAAMAAKAALFLAGFLGVLVIWLTLCHGLNLVAKLPGLHALNKALGGVLGLVKGVILLLVLRWVLCGLLNWIPAEVADGSYVLSFLSEINVFSISGS